VTVEYLQRAGLTVVAGDSDVAVEVLDEAKVRELAGRPELVHAAAALAGAVAAVEGIKQVLGLGMRADPLRALSLSSEDV
jgi:hypothetical protein